MVRLQFQGPAEAGDRFVQLSLVLQRNAQVVVRLGIVRLQFQCPAEAGDRFVQLPLVLEGNAQVVVCLGIVRLQFQCPAAAGDRFVQLSLVLQGKAQVVVCLGIVRLQFQCPAVAGDRFVQLPLVLATRTPRLLWASAKSGFSSSARRQQATASSSFPWSFNTRPRLYAGLGIVRLQFQCPAVAGERFVQLPLVLRRIAQVVVRLGIVRLQFQCPAVAGDRFVQTSPGPGRIAQVVMEGSHVPLQSDRSTYVLDGNFELAHLGSNHAQKMQRVGMLRLDQRICR